LGVGATVTGPPVGAVFSCGAVFGQVNPIASAPPTTHAVTVIQIRRRRQRYDARTRFTVN
jgi:hypothetical protein